MNRILPVLMLSLLFVLVMDDLYPQSVDNIANVEFQPDERVFTVMCAIHVGGYDYGLQAEAPDSFRRRVLEDIRRQNLPADLVKRLRDFYSRHNTEMDSAAQQPKYVSFALLLGPPPQFRRSSRIPQAPPQVTSLLGFETLVAEFYSAARIRSLWEKWRPALIADLNQTRDHLRTAIQDVLEFARIPARLYLNRRLVVIPDLIDKPNAFNVVHLEENYYLFLSPTVDPQNYHSFFVHEYLHYLLDPTMDAFEEKFVAADDLREMIQQSPHYGRYISDRFLLIRKSIINALQLQFPGIEPESSKDARRKMMRRDSPFLPFFENQLSNYTRSDLPLTEYVHAMLEETQTRQLLASYRKDTVPFLATETTAKESEGAVALVSPSKRQQELELAGELLQAGRLDQAEEILLRVLAIDPEDPNALFGMGQVKYNRQDYAAALAFYKKTLAAGDTPDWIRVWSMLKSGNCHVHREEFDQALSYFQQAADFRGDDRGASAAAQRALEQLRDRQSPR
ncbi:MAG: tetratricopeptide repeat protein [Acidobacteria bacterium]|nr:tetratricopeptide repeat protein [Acidobacteriota bacterium]